MRRGITTSLSPMGVKVPNYSPPNELEVNVIDNTQGHLLFIALMSCLPSQSWFSSKCKDGIDLGESILAGINLPSGTVYYMVPERYRDLLEKSGAPSLPLSYDSPDKCREIVINNLINFISR